MTERAQSENIFWQQYWLRSYKIFFTFWQEMINLHFISNFALLSSSERQVWYIIKRSYKDAYSYDVQAV
jgi:hypothetical protein